ATLAIVCGAVLPDVPMFVMYFWAKVIRRQSDYQIWSETYFESFWQNFTHAFHSIPLALISIFIAHYFGWWQVEIIGISAFLHALGDLPVHNEDAHRHFFPFSNYRFISPISYWNPKYHGRVVSLMEKLLVLIATFYIFPLLQSWVGKGSLIAVNLVYFSGYLYVKLFCRCQQINKQKELY
ncbi:hypothetical protein CBF18_13935, partial [Mastigocladus laminosus WC112]